MDEASESAAAHDVSIGDPLRFSSSPISSVHRESIAEYVGAGTRTERTVAYDYRDAGGNLLYQVVRGPYKRFYQRRPDPTRAGEWINDLEGVAPILYRLPELNSAAPSARVYVAEGEKDSDRLGSLGLVVTTNPMGAGKWKATYNASLEGRDVVVLPDADEVGRSHARAVAESLAGTAASVKILELPGLPHKGDVSDWLDAGGTVDELERLADAAEVVAAVGSVRNVSHDEKTVMEVVRPHFARLSADFGLRIVADSPNDHGWLTCRALYRDDARPSAGLNVRSGVYHDFGSKESLSFPELLAKLRPNAFRDRRAVLEYLAERYDVAPVADAWLTPVPFDLAAPPVFPVEALSEWQREFVEAVATATQTPVDLAAMLALSVVAVACAGKVEVVVRAGYSEPVNLFTATAQPPASRKSAVFRELLAPVEEFERTLVDQSKAAIAEALALRAIEEKALESLRRRAAKAKGPERQKLAAESRALARKLAEEAVPRPPRLLADDATPESLGSLLAENGGRLGVFSPEGGVLDILAGRYAANREAANYSVFLSGHAGDALRVDRKGRSSEFVARPALTLGLAVQPEVIRGMNRIPGARGRGLQARFLYSVPGSLVGRREVDPPPAPEQLRRGYGERVQALLAWRQDVKDAVRLGLTDEARTRWNAFAARLEPRLGPSGELVVIADWAGKLAGAVARIAGLLHMADHASNLTSVGAPLSAEVIDRAVLIGDYLIPHAKVAFALMDRDPLVDDAERLLGWIRRRVEGRGADRMFTKRDAFEALKGRFKRSAALDPPLELLASHGYIRPRDSERGPTRGRPPGPCYEVNPLAFLDAADRPEGASASSANYSSWDAEGSPGIIANCANGIQGHAPDLDEEGDGYEEGEIP
ncbi:DUF3987 domain-containing protein [Paludisphaera rhizosphaerae]|uniref:DUF3987 domain-containing protein n=1 Tax=Paludisphaera rhizosphaerae TaxID=2711216 RepID=UPI0013E9CA80|nr:DUF3987 domain-containing protein [Paludisphaera rhizosphaerae]